MIGVALVLLYFGLALLAAVVILQPDRFVVTRSAVIDAPPDVVFQHLNELRKWEGWSPWARLDPQAQGRGRRPGPARSMNGPARRSAPAA